MITIMNVAEARRTILDRRRAGQAEYPPRLLAAVAVRFGEGVSPEAAVARILREVRAEGEVALRRWSALLDGHAPDDFRVEPERIRDAASKLAPSIAEAMLLASDRIREFHRRQPLPSWQTTELGGILGQRVTPIEKVGVYVPGGTAPLPSSLLMSVIPAQVAGVPRIVVCTPPPAHPTILAAAQLCGLEEVYEIGGAQAVAAMAYGTGRMPRVDKIVGAGNLFVTLAKRQVFGVVGLDGLAGPTETMVIADDSARPAWVAADLLAQAEHDPLASAILLTPSRALAASVQAAVGQQLEGFSRADIMAQSLRNRGGIVVTPDLDTAVELANAYAAEHLCLAVRRPRELADRLVNAGGLFIGERSFEVLGDYVAGPSHVMPTGGSARFASPLNVSDFVKISSIIALDDQTSNQLSGVAEVLARLETLTGHAAAAAVRREGGNG